MKSREIRKLREQHKKDVQRWRKPPARPSSRRRFARPDTTGLIGRVAGKTNPEYVSNIVHFAQVATPLISTAVSAYVNPLAAGAGLAANTIDYVSDKYVNSETAKEFLKLGAFGLRTFSTITSITDIANGFGANPETLIDIATGAQVIYDGIRHRSDKLFGAIDKTLDLAEDVAKHSYNLTRDWFKEKKPIRKISNTALHGLQIGLPWIVPAVTAYVNPVAAGAALSANGIDWVMDKYFSESSAYGYVKLVAQGIRVASMIGVGSDLLFNHISGDKLYNLIEKGIDIATIAQIGVNSYKNGSRATLNAFDEVMGQVDDKAKEWALAALDKAEETQDWFEEYRPFYSAKQGLVAKANETWEGAKDAYHDEIIPRMNATREWARETTQTALRRTKDGFATYITEPIKERLDDLSQIDFKEAFYNAANSVASSITSIPEKISDWRLQRRRSKLEDNILDENDVDTWRAPYLHDDIPYPPNRRQRAMQAIKNALDAMRGGIMYIPRKIGDMRAENGRQISIADNDPYNTSNREERLWRDMDLEENPNTTFDNGDENDSYRGPEFLRSDSDDWTPS